MPGSGRCAEVPGAKPSASAPPAPPMPGSWPPGCAALAPKEGDWPGSGGTAPGTTPAACCAACAAAACCACCCCTMAAVRGMRPKSSYTRRCAGCNPPGLGRNASGSDAG